MPTSGVSEADRALTSYPPPTGIPKTNTRIVFDVGMNNGDDSAYYLSKGYRVIAVEANPALVEKARIRFAREIATGRSYCNC